MRLRVFAGQQELGRAAAQAAAPASILQTHPDTTVFLDDASAALL